MARLAPGYQSEVLTSGPSQTGFNEPKKGGFGARLGSGKCVPTLESRVAETELLAAPEDATLGPGQETKVLTSRQWPPKQLSSLPSLDLSTFGQWEMCPNTPWLDLQTWDSVPTP